MCHGDLAAFRRVEVTAVASDLDMAPSRSSAVSSVMTLTREQLEIEAQSLPRDERARLAEAIISSLEEEGEVERAWMEEIQRRVGELDSGAVETIPAEKVLAELDELVDR